MLNFKSRFQISLVLMTVTIGTSVGASKADADELSISEDCKTRSGEEKSSGDGLPIPGVSFPTRHYANHASAYNIKTLQLEVVQAGPIESQAVEGFMKSQADAPYNFDANRDFVTQMRSNSPPQAVQEPPRKRHRIGSNAGEFTAESRVVDSWMSSTSENPSAVKTVNFDEQMPPLIQDTATQAESTDGIRTLSSCLSSVELRKSVKKDSELPDSENKARMQMEKAGVQHHWQSGTWVSFRPQRNTFPFQHNPLYLEDPNLERCGHAHGYLTEVSSIAKFAGRIPILPYMMTVEPPCSLVKAKKDCPTGCSYGLDGYITNPNELDLGAAAVQAAVTVGIIFLIP